MSELEVLRRMAPATSAPSPSGYERAAARLDLRIRQEARPRLRRRLLRPGLGLVACAAVLASVLAGLSTRTTESAAAPVLERAAAAARAQEATPLAPGEYLYIRSINGYLATRSDAPSYSVLIPQVREVWLGRSNGRLRETSGKPVFLSARDRARWVASGRPPLSGGDVPGDVRIRSRALDLPSDPDAAYARLEAQARAKDSSFAWAMFQLIGDGFRELRTTPAQRAALYAAAARVPGIELVGNVSDRAGRAGVAIAVRDDAGNARLQLIVDPKTGVLLGEEEVVLEGNAYGYPAGTIIGYATYTQTAVVDGDNTRPAGVPSAAAATR